MNFEELKVLVHAWGDARGITTNSTPQAQCLKGVEELGELASGIARQDKALIADALGDLLVVEILLARLAGLDLVGCLEGAYETIKNRRGYLTASGVFIKEDPTFQLAEGAGHD